MFSAAGAWGYLPLNQCPEPPAGICLQLVPAQLWLRSLVTMRCPREPWKGLGRQRPHAGVGGGGRYTALQGIQD